MNMDDLATWHSRLRQAPNEEEVVALVNEFVGRLSEHDRLSIPEAVRPPVFADAAEIGSYNVQALRYELLFGGEPEVAALLKGIVSVLTEASARLSSLSLDTRLMRPR